MIAVTQVDCKKIIAQEAPAMRILMLTTKYHAAERGPYLSNELAMEFARHGHSVQVISLEWEPLAKPEAWKEPGSEPAIEVLRVPSLEPGGTMARMRKWVGSSIRARGTVRDRLPQGRFDLLFVFAPATPVHALIRWAVAISDRSFLYITDFFPFHQRFLGLIGPWPVFAAARMAERALVRRFDAIGCMSPAGLDYLRRNYPIRSDQRLTTMPPWSGDFEPGEIDRAGERARRGLPMLSPILLFGGQIVEGRGIEAIVAAARLAYGRGLDMTFALIGSGRLTSLVEREIAAGTATLRLLPSEPRETYLTLAAACDIGLVVTVPNVDVPTFPSKSIDYLRVGLPILAAVEASTDYGHLIEEWGVGRAIEAGDPTRLLDAALAMLADRKALSAMRAKGPGAAREKLSVRAAAAAVAQATGCRIDGA